MARIASLWPLWAALALAGASGFLASQAFGVGQQAPSRTVTVNVQNGATGPAGPRGATGPAGTETCPAGSSFGKLVINAPSGHVAVFTCIEN